MSTGEYIDTLLNEIERLRNERDLYENESMHLLEIIFDGIESPSYINPWGVFKYLKAIYPNKYKNKMLEFEADE